MVKTTFCIAFIVCIVFLNQHVYAQSGVGIGTSNPNPNAVLDIQSLANDKGILIPRLTSAERLAMNTKLSANENGLLVFDSDLQAFYYWSGSIWTSMSVVQDLQLIGNILSITKNVTATSIDLSPFSGTNTDNQDLSSSSVGNNRTINITGGNSTTFNVADNDNSVSNELQTISKVGSTVTLSNGGGSFTDAVNDADANASNELQTVSKVGSTVTLSNGGGSFSVNDADASTTNELQTISKAGLTVTLSNGGGSFTDAVNDADANASNELQTISKVGSTVTLSNGGGSFSVNDADASASNEIQTLSFSSSNLSISGGNSVTIPNSFQEAFKAFFSKPQTFLKGIFKIPFDVVEYDINGTYNPGAGNYTVPVVGIYRISGMVSILPVGLSRINLLIYTNGVLVYQQDAWPTVASDSQFSSYLFDTEVLINKGDVVEFYINSSAGFTLDAGNTKSYIAGRLVVQL